MVILLKLIKFIAAATERFMPQSSSSIPGSHTPGPCILGIDNGLTVTKAVVFDAGGRALAMARRRLPQIIPCPRHVERDMRALWTATAEAITEALAASGRAADIAAVAATAHGDGIYLLDHAGEPLGNGILSLDSRAAALADRWQADGTADAALARTGQMPHASAPAALLAWIRDNEPERYARIGHVLACKDWLRFCLTGVIGTDLTEASTSFTDVYTQAYAPDILPLFGLSALAHALPSVARPDEVVGHVSEAAARTTGLVAGTPVVAGLHDVTASALGIGGHGEGRIAIVAGTYSINETVSSEPKVDARWFCRNGLKPGEWNNMSISPASSSMRGPSALSFSMISCGDIWASLVVSVFTVLRCAVTGEPRVRLAYARAPVGAPVSCGGRAPAGSAVREADRRRGSLARRPSRRGHG